MTSISSGRAARLPRDVLERAPICHFWGYGRCRAWRRCVTGRIRCVRVRRPNHGVSYDIELFDFPDAWNIFRPEQFVEVTQVIFEIVYVVTLRPVIGVRIQIAQISAVWFLPIGKLGFHKL